MPDEAFRFSSATDGTSIQCYAWHAVGAPAASIVIAHGAAEHALRYERFARALNQAAIEVRALDHRGHGQSIGLAGLGAMGPAGWDGLVADIGQLIHMTRDACKGLPVVLFAHSLGSFAAQQWLPDASHAIDALILSGSTAVREPTEGAARPSFEPNKSFEPARTPYDWLSRDPVEVDKYIADPLCGFESVRPGQLVTFADLLRLSDPERLRNIRPDLPCLLLAGDEDPLNRRLEGLQLLEDNWRAAGVQRIDTLFYEGGRHEVLNEVNRDQVTQDVVSWLLGVLDAQGSRK